MNSIEKKSLFEYNGKKKVLNGFILIGFFILFLVIIIGLSLLFSKFTIFNNTIISSFMNFIGTQINNKTLVGVFLLAFIGGLFFVPIPIEPLYAGYVIKNSAQLPLLLFIFMVGVFISYSINLFIGYKFSNISRKIISTKKFYEIKVKLNKYGKLGVFLVNAIPFFPSQQVSLILGIFKYNKMKFYVYFLSGQLLKAVLIMGFMLLFK